MPIATFFETIKFSQRARKQCEEIYLSLAFRGLRFKPIHELMPI